MNILRRASTSQLIIAIVGDRRGRGRATAFAVAGGGGPKPPHRSLAARHPRAPRRQAGAGRDRPDRSSPTTCPVRARSVRQLAAHHRRDRPRSGPATGGCGSSCSPRPATPRSASTAHADGLRRLSGTAYTHAVRAPPRRGADGTTTQCRASPTSSRRSRSSPQHVDLSGAIPGDIAGQPSYTVRVSPRHSGGLLGSVQLAWDAPTACRCASPSTAARDSSPVLSLSVTDISFGAVPASDLAVPLAPGRRSSRCTCPHHPARPPA